MGISDESFYDERLVTSTPRGFCFPGKGKPDDFGWREQRYAKGLKGASISD